MARMIADLKTNEGLDVLVQLAPVVRRLASKEKLVQLYADIAAAPEDAQEDNGFKADITERLIEAWFKDCRAELLEIVQTIDGVSDEEIEAMGPMNMVVRVTELFKDRDFTGFFRSFVATPPKK